MTMITCTKCDELKEERDFYKGSTWCKQCHRDYQADKYARGREEIAALKAIVASEGCSTCAHAPHCAQAIMIGPPPFTMRPILGCTLYLKKTD